MDSEGHKGELRKISVAKRASKQRPETHSIRSLQRDRTDSLLANEGVLSQAAFTNMLERLADRAERGGFSEDDGFLVVFGDVNDMKAVNDTGEAHKAGDATLVSVGRALSEFFRVGQGDIIGRRGDEFLVIAPLYAENFGSKGPYSFARERMEGSRGAKGRIAKIQEVLKADRRDIAERYTYPAYPAGTTSLGWTYIDRDAFLEARQRAAETDDTDFFGVLLEMAEKDVYTQKKTRGTGSS